MSAVNSKILVAEDRPDQRLALSVKLPRVFRRSSISFVENGEEALKALRGKEYLATSPTGKESWIEKPGHFDAAFLDDSMPPQEGEDPKAGVGKWVAEELRRTKSEAGTEAQDRCILVSHSSSQIDLTTAGLFDAVVKKPGTMESYKEIAEMVEAYNFQRRGSLGSTDESN